MDFLIRTAPCADTGPTGAAVSGKSIGAILFITGKWLHRVGHRDPFNSIPIRPVPADQGIDSGAFFTGWSGQKPEIISQGLPAFIDPPLPFKKSILVKLPVMQVLFHNRLAGAIMQGFPRMVNAVEYRFFGYLAPARQW